MRTWRAWGYRGIIRREKAYVYSRGKRLGLRSYWYAVELSRSVGNAGADQWQAIEGACRYALRTPERYDWCLRWRVVYALLRMVGR
jgi:hypothetical protein